MGKSFLKNISDGIQNVFVSSARWLQETKRKMSPLTESFGVTGSRISGQFLLEEQNSNLQSLEERCRVFDEIEKGCPPARLSYLVYRLPLLSATWDFSIDENLCKKKGVSPQLAEEMTEFVRFNLMENNQGRFKKRIGEHLLFKKYGFSLSEIVWDIQEGRVLLKDLEFRHPRTVLWDFDENNRLKGITQRNYYGKKQSKYIPRDKLLLFAQNDEGDNVEGVADLRYMYRSYREWDVQKRLILTATQRQATGFLIVTAPSGANYEERSVAEKFVNIFAQPDKIGGILPEGWTAEIKESTMTGMQATLGYKQELDREIFMTFLAIHVLPVLKGSGSLALSKDASDFFGMALQSDADLIADVYNYDLIPKLIDANYNTEVYPEVHLTIREEDLQQFIDNVVKVIGAGIIPVCEQIQEQLGSRMNLPEIDYHAMTEEKKQEEMERIKAQKPMEEQPDKKPAEPQKKSKNDCGGRINQGQETSPAQWEPNRSLTPLEEKIGGVKYLQSKKNFLDKKIKEFQNEITPILKKQSEAVVHFALKNKDNPSAVMNFVVPYQDEYRKTVEKFLIDSGMEGIKSIGQETGNPLSTSIITSLKQWAGKKAIILTQRSGDDLIYFVVKQMSGNIDGIETNVKSITAEMTAKTLSEFLSALSND